MSIEEAIKHCNEVADSYNDTVPDCDCASDHRQLASWLQELKERREKEQRGIGIGKPYCIVQVDKDMVKRTIDKAINNLYYKCPYCGAKMNPQRKEESK